MHLSIDGRPFVITSNGERALRLKQHRPNVVSVESSPNLTHCIADADKRRVRRLEITLSCTTLVATFIPLLEFGDVSRYARQVGWIAEADSGTLFSVKDGPGLVSNLWVADGGSAHATQITNFDSSNDVLARYLSIDGEVLFVARSGNKQEPWVSDGTPSGTYQLGDFAPASDRTGLSKFTRLREGLVWVHYSEPNNLTVIRKYHQGVIEDIASGESRFSSLRIWSYGNYSSILLAEEIDGMLNWRVFEDSVLTTPINLGGTAETFRAVSSGQHVFFNEFAEVLIWDGGEPTKVLDQSFVRYAISNDSTEEGAIGRDESLFEAKVEDGKTYVFRTDGTARGTVQISEVPLFPVNSLGSKVALANGNVYFSGWSPTPNDPNVAYDPYVFNGDATVKLEDLRSNGPQKDFVGHDGLAYFLNVGNAHSDGRRDELWVTDGTQLGTKLITRRFQEIDHITVANDRLYIVALDTELNSRGIWVSE